jgi:hypothetical protein
MTHDGTRPDAWREGGSTSDTTPAEVPQWAQAQSDRLLMELAQQSTTMRDALAAALVAAAERGRPETRWFPIQANGHTPHPMRVPWSVAERAYSVYAARYGTDQTLERLAERGGFGAYEMDIFLPFWRKEVDALAQAEVQVAALNTENDRLHAMLAREAREHDERLSALTAELADCRTMRLAMDVQQRALGIATDHAGHFRNVRAERAEYDLAAMRDQVAEYQRREEATGLGVDRLRALVETLKADLTTMVAQPLVLDAMSDEDIRQVAEINARAKETK